MKKRLITGTVYVAVLVGFFFLRWVDVRLFGILVYAFSLIGTFEMARAFSHVRTDETGAAVPPALPLSLSQKIALGVYTVLFVPTFYAVAYFAGAAEC